VLDAQIIDLQMRREEISLAWPIILMLGSGALGVAGIAATRSNSCATDSYGRPIDPNCVRNPTAVEWGTAMFAGSFVGLAFGSVSLIIRTAKRRHLASQIHERQIEANALRGLPPPRWSVSPTRDGGGLFSVALDF
jgi:hypothetical protein